MEVGVNEGQAEGGMVGVQVGADDGAHAVKLLLVIIPEAKQLSKQVSPELPVTISDWSLRPHS